MKDREIKTKREIEILFLKPIFVSIEDKDRFEEEGLKKKIRPIKNTWYDWLINYIPKPIRTRASVLKDNFISLFKTNIPKQNIYGRGQKLSKPRKQNIKKLFYIRREQRKKLRTQ